MLGRMVGPESVGIYAVAARLSEMWYVVPAVIGASIAPRLFQLRRSDPDVYLNRLKQAFSAMFWLGVGVALPISILATPLIGLLYGEQFRSAGLILSIHIWTCPFIFMGTVLQNWFLAEDLLPQIVIRSLVGVVLAVVLNLLLIPTLGGVGAAISTLVAYTGASYLGCFFSSKTFRVGVWMTEAMFWPLHVIRQPA
jgi:O-antigen/teichoic acid export membrane protein